MGFKTCKKILNMVHKNMQIKIMMKYHFSPIRLATTLKSANTLAGKGVGKEVLSYRAGGTVNWHRFHGGKFGNIYQN